ncbi:MAG TPA: RNA polymerase sigma factor [Armatimonadetes bacterium]|nr:RNA polymerase sigma factor [Armatimonadota bacterium]
MVTTNEIPMASDEALMEALCAGDDAAFDALLRRYRTRVLNFAHRLLGDRDAAEDVAQQTFVQVYTRCQTFRTGQRFSTWLYAIAKNLCRKEARRLARRGDFLPLAEVTDEPAPPHFQPEVRVEQRERIRRVREALAQLPLAQRTLIVLYEYEGWPHADIAAVLGCSVTACKVRLHRARQRLRTLLADLLEA